MKLIKPYDIFKMTSPRQATCLTIYLNNPSEISDLMAEARRLASTDLIESEINELLAPVRYLTRSKKWLSNTQPMGIFVTPGFSGFMKIPFQSKSLSVVAHSFHVKPLIKWLQREKPFFLLHLDREKAILFQGSLSGLKQIETFDYIKSRSFEFSIERLERAIIRIVQKTNQPLLLSGNQNLAQYFKSISSYKMILEDLIYDVSSVPNLRELHLNCIHLLEPYLEKTEDSLVRKYWLAKAQGSVSSNLNEIVALALSAQVRHLFINENINIWGVIDYQKATFTYSSQQLDAHDDDVLDDLAELVLYNGGKVTVLPSSRMPDSQAASAILKRSFKIEKSVTNSLISVRYEERFKEKLKDQPLQLTLKNASTF